MNPKLDNKLVIGLKRKSFYYIYQFGNSFFLNRWIRIGFYYCCGIHDDSLN